MSAAVVLRQMLKERARTTLWWSIALVALALVLGLSYPTVRREASGVNDIMESLPEGLTELLGATGGVATPDGWLNSQYYSNIYPILLLVFGVAAGAWTIAGAEREGTLEPLLANPVRRSRVALGRFIGVVVLLAVLSAVSTAVLIAIREPSELDAVSVGNLIAAGVGTYLLCLLFASVTYAVGAASGRKGLAIAAGTGAAAATYIVFALASFVAAFESMRWLSPWYWFLDKSALTEGYTVQATVLPLTVIIPVAIAGTIWFTRRDIR